MLMKIESIQRFQAVENIGFTLCGYICECMSEISGSDTGTHRSNYRYAT